MRWLAALLMASGLGLLAAVPVKVHVEEQSLRSNVVQTLDQKLGVSEDSVRNVLNATLTLPSENLHSSILPGVSPEELDKGVGHYPFTALPGEKGNFGIAVHRPLVWDIDEMGPGDEIIVTNNGVKYTYEWRESFVVAPDRVDVLDSIEGKWLTLTTCHPRYSNAERLIVRAELTQVGG